MGFDELARKLIDSAVAAFVRPQLDIGFRVSGQSVEIFGMRPRWNRRQDSAEGPVAGEDVEQHRRIDGGPHDFGCFPALGLPGPGPRIRSMVSSTERSSFKRP